MAADQPSLSGTGISEWPPCVATFRIQMVVNTPAANVLFQHAANRPSAVRGWAVGLLRR